MIRPVLPVARGRTRAEGPAARSRAQSPLFAPATARSVARVLVIAELGVNHDGDPQRAVDLVRLAAEAGADAIKLQLFDPEHLLANQARLAPYQERAATDLFSMLQGLQLGPSAMARVRDAAGARGLGFIVTLFSLPDLGVLRDLDVDAVKIASPDAVNHPLLRAADSLDRPLLVSTGTCDLEELCFAAELLHQRPPGGCLLQCVSSYPTDPQDAAIGGLVALGARFGLPVGYSDHTQELHTGALAVAAGACVIEKHLTHDRTAAGPDHRTSLEPDDLAHYVALVRRASQMLGPLAKNPGPAETDVRQVSRQSLCARRDLEAGRILGAADLAIKRPGTGIPAAALDRTLGQRLRRPVRTNDLLMPEDLA